MNESQTIDSTAEERLERARALLVEAQSALGALESLFLGIIGLDDPGHIHNLAMIGQRLADKAFTAADTPL